MTYVLVHRGGRVVACLHTASMGLVRLDRAPKKGETVTFVVLQPPQEPEE